MITTTQVERHQKTIEASLRRYFDETLSERYGGESGTLTAEFLPAVFQAWVNLVKAAGVCPACALRWALECTPIRHHHDEIGSDPRWLSYDPDREGSEQ